MNDDFNENQIVVENKINSSNMIDPALPSIMNDQMAKPLILMNDEEIKPSFDFAVYTPLIMESLNKKLGIYN